MTEQIWITLITTIGSIITTYFITKKTTTTKAEKGLVAKDENRKYVLNSISDVARPIVAQNNFGDKIKKSDVEKISTSVKQIIEKVDDKSVLNSNYYQDDLVKEVVHGLISIYLNRKK